LEQKLLILERKLELERERAAEAARKGAAVSAAPGKGLSVATGDGRFAFNVSARAQLRETLSVGPNGLANEINVKTLRLFFRGNLFTPDLRYVVQLALGPGDFEPDNASPIFDAFVEYTRLRALRIRVGQYFVPFDRARTIREWALHFVDRQQVVRELTLDRDVGLMLSSDDLGRSRGIVGYALYIGGGEGRNRVNGHAVGGLYVGRLILRPFGNFTDDQEGDLERLFKPRLAIGLAGGYNQNTNRPRSTQGTPYAGGVTFDYVQAAADLHFKYAGFALLAEVVYRQAREDFADTVDERGTPLRQYSRSGLGYFLQAGMMVHRLVEVVARWDQLFGLGDTDPALLQLVARQGKQAGAGLNVYLNGHAFKFQTDYFFVFGDDPAQARHEWRLQLDATF
jgi:hypothetical protein